MNGRLVLSSSAEILYSAISFVFLLLFVVFVVAMVGLLRRAVGRKGLQTERGGLA